MTNSTQFLISKLEEELLLYFPKAQSIDEQSLASLVKRWQDDSVFSEKHRFDTLLQLVPNAKEFKILDMAAGCGSFVIQGLRNGWDVFGIEPEKWKHELINMKFAENNYDPTWRNRIMSGVGEALPFENASFQHVNSWQTFEHVGNVDDCLKEFYRVLESGGTAIIRCPSYCSFFEGHYRMFWFPMMGDGMLAKLYLRLRNRPINGLKTFHPIHLSMLTSKAKKAGFNVFSIKRIEIAAAVERKLTGVPKSIVAFLTPVIFWIWSLTQGIKRFGKSENYIHVLLKKP